MFKTNHHIYNYYFKHLGAKTMDFKTLSEYLKTAGVRLTATQAIMVQRAVAEDKFIGVGYEIGRSKPQPLVTLGKNQLNIINEQGYRCLASPTRAYIYPSAPKTEEPKQ